MSSNLSLDTAMRALEIRRLTLPAHKLPSRKRNRTLKPDVLSALPTEIRQQIYTYYFANSIIRYYRRIHFHRGKPMRRAYCNGPSQIALLLTNRTIYHEALPILLCSLTLLIDRTEAFNALRTISRHTPIWPTKHTCNPFPPLLASLTRAIRHLILSEIYCRNQYHQIEPLSRPQAFPHLHTVTLFGVYPGLEDFLDYGAPVWLGRSRPRRWYRWPANWLSRPPHAVDLNAAALKLHGALGRNAKDMRIRLCAWCRRSWSVDERVTLLLVRASLDDATTGYRWDVLAWKDKEKGRRGRNDIAAPRYPVRLGSTWERFTRETAVRRRRLTDALLEEGTHEDTDPTNWVRWPTSGWGPRFVSSEQWLGSADEFWAAAEEDEVWLPQIAAAVAVEEQQPPQAAGINIGNVARPDDEDEEDIDALVSRLRPPPKQELTRRHETPAAANSSEQLASLPDKDVDNWASITETGDWQSVRSRDVAFKQWDAALDLSLAAGARW